MSDLPTRTPPVATLAVQGLRKRFGRKVAVDGISFRMTVSEVVGLLGPNGAGKTTAFFMIAGFIEPSEGSVLLESQDITRLPMYRRARRGIAYLPQEPSVFRRLTVRQNVLAVLETRRMPRGQRHELCDELLAELGIEKIADQKAHTLSGGERRRTEIARALASDPRFLLLDEPFAGIDPIAVHHLKEVVRSLSGRGIGILLTDHNVRDALEITDRSYIIDGGHIIAEGSREALLADPAARSAYLGEEFRM